MSKLIAINTLNAGSANALALKEFTFIEKPDVPNTVGAPRSDTFADPRAGRDRRHQIDATSIPATGCRRRGSRRATFYITNDQWWMKRNYNNDR